MNVKKETILHNGIKRTSYYDPEGFYHREDGPAVQYSDGLEEYYHHGIRHREDGPALIGKTMQEWYHNGAKHRLDGPATIYFDSDQVVNAEQFYIYGAVKTPVAWAQFTGHKVCKKCLSFCRQRCDK